MKTLQNFAWLLTILAKRDPRKLVVLGVWCVGNIFQNTEKHGKESCFSKQAKAENLLRRGVRVV